MNKDNETCDMTITERLDTAIKCVPESPYRDSLSKLRDDIIARDRLMKTAITHAWTEAFYRCGHATKLESESCANAKFTREMGEI